MSHSRRNSPVIATTTATSEKEDKILAHRLVRRTIRLALKAAACHDDDSLIVEPVHPRCGGWHFAKDGKGWHHDAEPSGLRK